MSGGYTTYDSDELGGGVFTRRLKEAAAKAEGLVNGGPKVESAVTPFEIIEFASLGIRAPSWVWQGYIPREAIIALTGEVGTGKSVTVLDLGARLTSEQQWPDHSPPVSPQNIIVMTSEDHLQMTVLPRLMGANAELKRCKSIKLMTKDVNGKKRPIILSQDMDRLEATVREIGNVGMVIFDPIVGFVGTSRNTNIADAADVRGGITGKIKEMAEELGFAAILVTNTPKGSKVAIESFIGSGAWLHQARAGYITVKEVDEDGAPTGRIYFQPARPLTIAATPPGRAYRLGQLEVGRDEKTRAIVSAPTILWETDAVEITADQALQASRGVQENRKAREREEERKSAIDRAEEFLRKALRRGAVKVKELQEHAQGEAVGSWRTVEAAKRRLGERVKADFRLEKAGKQAWYWVWDEVANEDI